MTQEERKELNGSDDHLSWESKNVSIRFHLWEETLEFIQAQQENRSLLVLILQTIRTNNGTVFNCFVQAAKEIFDVQVRNITSEEVAIAIDYQKEN